MISRAHWPGMGRFAAIGLVIVAAVVTGLVASSAALLLVVACSLLPLFAQVRHVGASRSLTEPTVPTAILLFYFAFFPLRALGLLGQNATDFNLAWGAVTPTQLGLTIVVASIGVTFAIEAYYFAIRSRAIRFIRIDRSHDTKPVLYLAAFLTLVSSVGLLIILARHGGIAGTQETALSHAKDPTQATSDGSLQGSVLSLYSLVSVPTVWLLIAAIVSPGTTRGQRVVAIAVVATLLTLFAVLFGSRLNIVMSLLGGWTVAFIYGVRPRLRMVLASVVAIVVVSFPILNARSGSESSAPLRTRLTQLVGYGVLDTVLAIEQRPTQIRDDLARAGRWVSFPLYLIPAALWSGRPGIDDNRMDVFVARNLGNANHQNTGYPASYMTELWLYGGVPVIVLGSIAFGLLSGYGQRKLLPSRAIEATPATAIWSAFLVTSSFTYFKDGDILVTTLSVAKSALYLGLLMFVFGVWTPTSRDSANHPELRRSLSA